MQGKAMLAAVLSCAMAPAAAYEFGPADTVVPASTGVVAMTAGDLDGDGFDDLVVVTGPGSNQPDRVLVYLQDPETGLGAPVALPFGASGEGSYGVSTALLDVDRDGDLDIVVARGGGSSGLLAVLRNDGGAGFALSTSVGPGATGTLHLMDIDGDGDDDLLSLARTSGSAIMYRDAQGGRFFDSLPFEVGAAYQEVDLADVDGDGRRDLVYSVGSGEIRMRRHLGTGFAGRSELLVQVRGASWLSTFDAGDLDGDGRADLLADPGYNVSSQLVVYRQRGDGRGFEKRLVARDGITSQYVLHDLDGDGLLDMIGDARFPSALTARFGDGRGFGPPIVSPTTQQVMDMAFGDFDGDGANDVLMRRLDGSVDRVPGRFDLPRGDLAVGLRLERDRAVVRVDNAGTATSSAHYVAFSLTLRQGAFAPTPLPEGCDGNVAGATLQFACRRPPLAVGDGGDIVVPFAFEAIDRTHMLAARAEVLPDVDEANTTNDVATRRSTVAPLTR